MTRATWCALLRSGAAPAPEADPAAWASRWREAGWTPAADGPGWRLWSRDGAPEVHPLPRASGVVLGRLHRHPDWTGEGPEQVVAALAALDPRAAANRLLAATWGSYVALLGAGGSDDPAVLRDPSGMLEAFCWRTREGMAVVADAVWGLPVGLAPPRLSINWDRLALGLVEPVASIVEPPLDGFEAVAPGALHRLAGGASTMLWRPDHWTADNGLDAQAASEALVERIDACVRDLVAPHRCILGEVSGGLDSAIIAASTARSGLAGRAPAWLNVWSPLGGADERRYARAVAAPLGLRLREVALEPADFGDDDYEGLLDGVRPPVTAASREYDRTLHDLAAELGATALLTGEGGDAVLFQSPSPLVFADLLAARGPAALLSPALLQHAHRTRRSVWTLAATAIGALSRPRGLPAPRTPLPGGVAVAGRWRHPWTGGIDYLSPAKRLHVLGVANAQVHTSHSRRRLVVEPLNPMLAQPVLELCLGLPTPLLALGGRDRGLARRAFADRLPPMVAERRAKGDMTLFYAQVVCRSLPWLREHLIGGCLAQAEVIDAAALDRALTPEHLAQAGGASAIIGAALTESWVRHWQRRVPDTVGAVRGPAPEVRLARA